MQVPFCRIATLQNAIQLHIQYVSATSSKSLVNQYQSSIFLPWRSFCKLAMPSSIYPHKIGERTLADTVRILDGCYLVQQSRRANQRPSTQDRRKDTGWHGGAAERMLAKWPNVDTNDSLTSSPFFCCSDGYCCKSYLLLDCNRYTSFGRMIIQGAPIECMLRRDCPTQRTWRIIVLAQPTNGKDTIYIWANLQHLLRMRRMEALVQMGKRGKQIIIW